ncbi:hypothetical protein MTsPCn5_04620 [Croceitalea sp. MTPC5]|uniref:hypothetical protein n=1 Tax=Croceitalea sp. MTPC5 TaxID=3056565 RepID=UPI002B3C6624|nr:hypothetical protein MTsPCn5_04620 [Croceitalea sp. MTPC5]
MFIKVRWLVFVYLLASCSQGDNQEDPNPTDENPDTIDIQEPTVSIDGLNAVVEVNSNLTISVSDESATTTQILLDGEELFSTSDTQFEFTLSPYKFPVGNAVLKIISTDNQNNSFTEEYPLEFKHLIMQFEFGADEQADKDGTWVFFNDLNGKLIQYFKPVIGVNKIYTDSIINEDQVYYTITQYDTDGGNVIHNLVNTSYLLNLGQFRRQTVQSEAFSPNGKVKFEIQTIDPVSNFSKYFARGTNYLVNSIGGFESTEILGIDFEYPETIFVCANEIGKKEDYLYTTINPEQSSTEISVPLDENNFSPMDDFISQSAPAFDNGTFRFDRWGYETEIDLMNDVSHSIYSIGLDNSSEYLDLPILNGLEFYKNRVRYSLNGRTFINEQFGNSLNLNAPNWDMIDFGVIEGFFYLESNGNEGVDYYLIRSSKSSGPINFTEPSKRFIWVHRTFDNINGRNTTPFLEFPPQITEDLNDTFYSPDGLSIEYAVAVNFENIDRFSQIADYFALGNLNLQTEEKGFKSLRFPISVSSSDKKESKLNKKELLESKY